MSQVFDAIDKKIIEELDIDARQSSAAIAKKVRVAKETVNFRIRRLLEQKVIKGFYPLINIAKLGRQFFKIFLKFKELNPERKETILNFLAEQEGMSQVLVLEGIYDVQLFILAKSYKGVLTLLEKINEFCGKEIKDKEILIVDTMYRFNLKVRDSGSKDIIHKVGQEITRVVGDDISTNMLKILTKDARIPLIELAKQIGISAQLAQYHLKKLIKEGILLSTHVAINYDFLKKQHCHLTMQLSDSTAIPGIITFFRETKHAIFATRMLGNYDVSAEVFITNNEELRTLVNALLTSFSESITTLDVLLIYKEYQLELYPL